MKVVVDDFVASGSHTAMWDGTNTLGAPSASGIYFVRMTAGDFRNTKKVVLLK